MVQLIALKKHLNRNKIVKQCYLDLNIHLNLSKSNKFSNIIIRINFCKFHHLIGYNHKDNKIITKIQICSIIFNNNNLFNNNNICNNSNKDNNKHRDIDLYYHPYYLIQIHEIKVAHQINQI